MKFSDGSSLQVINESMNPPIGTGRMFGPFPAIAGKQASQMNFKVGPAATPPPWASATGSRCRAASRAAAWSDDHPDTTKQGLVLHCGLVMASVMIAKGIRASMQIIRGPEIENHIDDLGKFRIEIFREYPYLYDGNIQFERVYLSPYSRNPESLLLILQDAHGIIGACTGTPLTGEDNDFQNAFVGENKDEIYYIGAVILRADSRSKARFEAVVHSFVANRYEKI